MNQSEVNRIKQPQSSLILKHLCQRAQKWVPMTELSSVGNPGGFCMVHSRIADLRKRGCVIGNRTEKSGQEIRSFYRLVKMPDAQLSLFE